MRKLKNYQRHPLAGIILSIFCLLILLGILLPQLPSLAKPQQVRVFEQIWQRVNDSFFDPKFNGVDWQAIKTKYQPQAAKSKSQEEFAVVINQMLSELKTSHTHYYTEEDQEYYQLLGIFQPRSNTIQQQIKKFFPKSDIEYSGIGILTRDINGKTFIRGVLDNSPAEIAGIKAGDQIINVDGRPYKSVESFAGKVGQQVKILIQSSPDIGSQKEVIVTPKTLNATKMFLDAQEASVKIIEKQDKKIGYIHIWSYAGDQYQKLLENELIDGRLRDADALILDLRDGWGGAEPNYLNIFTAKGPSITLLGRDRQPVTLKHQWEKPVVMLVNKGTRSGKEILAFGFQQYKIGKVIGSQTAGAVVAGTAYLMNDKSMLFLAVADVLVDGKYRLEAKGITPDINVAFQLEYAQGKDPQKEKAVEVLLGNFKT
jgi:carboxyl-terminal processing protease